MLTLEEIEKRIHSETRLIHCLFNLARKADKKYNLGFVFFEAGGTPSRLNINEARTLYREAYRQVQERVK